MRYPTLVATTLAAVFTSSFAFAELPENPKKGAPKRPVVVASAEPLPVLPPSAPEPAAPPVAQPTQVDSPANTPATNEPPSAGTGLVWGVAGGTTVLGGQLSRSRDAGAALATINAKVGFYVTPQVGIFAGLQGGYGASWGDGCNKCINAFSFQLPVQVQYAFADRSRGAYVDGGLAFFTMYGAHTNEGRERSMVLRAPVDVKLGIGYRFGRGATAEKAAPQALDLRFGLDLGRFSSVGGKGGGAEGEISDSRQAMHYAFGFSIGSSWAQ